MTIYKTKPPEEKPRYKCIPSRLMLADHIKRCLNREDSAQEMIKRANDIWDMSRYPEKTLMYNYQTWALMREFTCKRKAFGQL